MAEAEAEEAAAKASLRMAKGPTSLARDAEAEGSDGGKVEEELAGSHGDEDKEPHPQKEEEDHDDDDEEAPQRNYRLRARDRLQGADDDEDFALPLVNQQGAAPAAARARGAGGENAAPAAGGQVRRDEGGEMEVVWM